MNPQAEDKKVYQHASSPVAKLFKDNRIAKQTFATHIPPHQRLESDWCEINIINGEKSKANNEIREIELDLDDIQIQYSKNGPRKLTEKEIFVGMVVIVVLLLIVIWSIIVTREAEYEREP